MIPKSFPRAVRYGPGKSKTIPGACKNAPGALKTTAGSLLPRLKTDRAFQHIYCIFFVLPRSTIYPLMVTGSFFPPVRVE
jgi:hypothetical protein